MPEKKYRQSKTFQISNSKVVTAFSRMSFAKKKMHANEKIV